MKKTKFLWATLAIVITFFISCSSDDRVEDNPTADVYGFLNTFDYSKNSFSHNGFSLNYTITSGSLNSQMKKDLVENFFKIYPKIHAEFNNTAPKSLIFEIKSAIDFPAYAIGNTATYQSEWLQQHPEDRDVSTHEMMHIVQAYNFNNVPGWITEGIAEFVRDKYGLSNAGWSLTPYANGQNYTDGYGITGRFLKWIEIKVKPGFIKYLNDQCRTGNYSDTTWSNYTGKTIQQLWDSYKANPTV